MSILINFESVKMHIFKGLHRPDSIPVSGTTSRWPDAAFLVSGPSKKARLVRAFLSPSFPSWPLQLTTTFELAVSRFSLPVARLSR